MKTIAISLNTSWNIYNFRMGLLTSLQEEGYKIVTIAPRDKYSSKLEDFGFEYHEIKINNKGTNPIEDLKLVFAFYKLYKKIAPDVLLQYTIKPNVYGSLAAGVLGIPIISNISGLGTVFLNNSFSSKIARMLYKVALKIPKKVFYQNAHDQKLFITSNLVKAKKTGLLPGSGIDPEIYKPIIHKSTDKKIFHFLFIARLLKDKGLFEYIDAIRLLKSKYAKVEFAILGAYYPGNPTAITPEEMCNWEDDNIVKYLGTNDNIKPFIAKADCIVLPSYREGLSRVLLEAASMAKPIITTNVPGCRDVVIDGVNGFLCKVKNAKDLAKQMEKMLLLEEAQRIKMGEKGRDKVKNEFDENIVINRYKETIKFILESHPH